MGEVCMNEKLCEWCGDQFYPRELKQRFCCRACSVSFYDEERREGVRLYRRLKAEEAEERRAS
jgi:hypothetical protein